MSDRGHKRARTKGCSIAAIGVMVPLLLSCLFLFFGDSLMAPSAARVERGFQENKEAFVTVRDFLFESGFEEANVSINTLAENEMFAGLDYGRVSIDDREALAAMHHLFSRGYRIISRSENHIRFQGWSTLDRGRGVLYLAEGSTPHSGSVSFSELETLSEEGWYFYESH